MSHPIRTRLLLATLAAVLSTLAPVAMAREGAQSVGKGIKCYTGYVTQADGTVKAQRICYKGV